MNGQENKTSPVLLQRNNNTHSFLAYFREINKYPPETLAGSTIKVGKAAPDHLEIHEITAWKNHDFEGKNAALERGRNLFLIQIYTGFYYNDLRDLLKTELKTDPEYGFSANVSQFLSALMRPESDYGTSPHEFEQDLEIKRRRKRKELSIKRKITIQPASLIQCQFSMLETV